jgi:cytochrome bd-type quinol oxidase subunit 1
MKKNINGINKESGDDKKINSVANIENKQSFFLGGMKRFWILVIFFLIFFAFVALFVYPEQKGMISSTELLSSQINQTNPVYNETLPIQTVGINNQGRSMFIALIMLTHVIFANLHLGGSWFAVGSETIFLIRKRNRFNRIAQSMTLFNVILFSFGATFAIAGVLFFIALFPTFATNVFHIYWWPLFIEAILFATEIVFLYSYWFSWKKLSKRKHQVLGYGYALSVFFQTLMINMLAAGMLTPGIEQIQYYGSGIMTISLSEAFATWFNPTLWNLQWHRLFASIAFIGLIFAMLGAFHYISRKGNQDRKYWDWVASYGLSWGLLGLIIQPFLGLEYMLTISNTNNGAFQMIMHGPRAWEMLLMIGSFSFLFLTIILYFIERREKVFSEMETRYLSKLFIAFFIISAIATFILIQPSWVNTPFLFNSNAIQNPLGLMAYKYIALGALILIGVAILTIDLFLLRKPNEGHWGDLTYAARGCLIFIGLLGIFIILIMGFVRESARAPWTVSQIIPVAGGMNYPTPLTIENILFVWIFVTLIILATFWITSKATAHHPEKAEEI